MKQAQRMSMHTAAAPTMAPALPYRPPGYVHCTNSMCYIPKGEIGQLPVVYNLGLSIRKLSNRTYQRACFSTRPGSNSFATSPAAEEQRPGTALSTRGDWSSGAWRQSCFAHLCPTSRTTRIYQQQTKKEYSRPCFDQPPSTRGAGSLNHGGTPAAAMFMHRAPHVHQQTQDTQNNAERAARVVPISRYHMKQQAHFGGGGSASSALLACSGPLPTGSAACCTTGAGGAGANVALSACFLNGPDGSKSLL